jgi:hypothetical protein
VNGAPLFDLVVQVDDRNTSRYVLSVSLPRQSGIVPQFHSPLPRDLLRELEVLRSERNVEKRRRTRRQFIDIGEGLPEIHDDFPDPAMLEALNNADPSLDSDPFLPDANFLQSIQV